MKLNTKLTSLLAQSLVAQDEFIHNLTVAINANPNLATILADTTAPNLTKEDVEKRVGRQVVDFKLIFAENFEWRIEAHYKVTRYFKTQEDADKHNSWNNSSTKQSDEYPIEGWYIDYNHWSID